MAKISAQEVKKLRDKTGASVMECRAALEKAKGNEKDAIELLKKRGREKAGKKSGRETEEGVIASYIHSNKKIGSMIELRCETDFVAKNSEFQELAYDLAMHIAALAPSYLSVSDVPGKDRNEYEHLVREEMAADMKSDEVMEMIIAGKLKKHFEEISLLEQKFVKNPDISVGDFVKEKIAKIGENIQIGAFTRFEI